MKKLLLSLFLVGCWSGRVYSQYGVVVVPAHNCSPSRYQILTPQQREAIVAQRMYQMISRTDDSMVSRYQTSTDPYIRQAAYLVAKERLMLKELNQQPTIKKRED